MSKTNARGKNGFVQLAVLWVNFCNRINALNVFISVAPGVGNLSVSRDWEVEN